MADRLVHIIDDAEVVSDSGDLTLVCVLTGFLDDGKARGRPVGVALDGRGGLLVADDVGNKIWRVSAAGAPAAVAVTAPIQP